MASQLDFFSKIHVAPVPFIGGLMSGELLANSFLTGQNDNLDAEVMSRNLLMTCRWLMRLEKEQTKNFLYPNDTLSIVTQFIRVEFQFQMSWFEFKFYYDIM